jgi:drug/metabolite transporter (DMT)-like permease
MSAHNIPSKNHGDRIGLGITYAIVGIACMSVLDSIAKLLTEGYSIWQLVFFRNFFGLLFVLAMLWQSGGLRSLRSEQPLLHGVRILFSLVATFTFFTGLRYLPLAEAFAITFAGPIFITALSVPVLGEKVGARRWSAILIGLVGVVMILRPGSAVFQVDALWPLTAAFGYAVVMLTTRKLTRRDSTISILFWTAFSSTLITSLALPWNWTAPSSGDWGLFVLLGMAGSFTMFFMAQAYRHAPAAVIAPFDYTILLWGIMFGWLIWQELPDPGIWPGVAVLVASGLYIIHRETRRARRR